MQQRRYPANHFKSDKSRQHEHVKTRQQIQFHALFSSTGRPAASHGGRSSVSRAASPYSPRNLSFTISPPLVIKVSRIISSCRSVRNFPSFTRCSRKVVTFFAYIWL